MDARNDILAWARFFESHKARIHYKEIRPMPLTAKPDFTTDCSGFFTNCYWCAGAGDPNKRRYDRQGYTGTLLSAGTEIGIDRVEPADAVIYGPGTGWHVGIVVERVGNNILTISHGQEGDPSYVWANRPTCPDRGYPYDGREPQRYVRFVTRRVRAPQRLLSAIIRKVAPKPPPPPQNAPAVHYQRPA